MPRIELSRFDMTPAIDPPMGEGVLTNHKSSNRIELSQLGRDKFKCY